MPPQDELVGNRFHHPVTVADTDIDANGHVNNVSYVRWVQEAATAHWNAVVTRAAAAGLSWVVLRHEIDYKSPAFRSEELSVSTWLGELTAATSERFCEVRRRADGALLARARTLWCAIDAVTGRPKRIGPEIRGMLLEV